MHNTSDDPEKHGAVFNRSDIWNKEQALERLGGDTQLLHEIVRIFVEVAPAHIADLHNAVAIGDATAMVKAAHKLRGELGCLALPELSAKARELEEIHGDADAPRLKNLVSVLEVQVRQALALMHETCAHNQEVGS